MLQNPYNVLVIDGDKQGSASKWLYNGESESRLSCPVINLHSAGAKAHREIAKFVNSYDYIIIDCPPYADIFSKAALMISDLAIIPLKPGSLDIAAVSDTIALIEETCLANESLQYRILLNMFVANQKISKEALTFLKDSNIPSFSYPITQRTSYSQASTFGSTIDEMNDGKATLEVTRLTKEVLAILNA